VALDIAVPIKFEGIVAINLPLRAVVRCIVEGAAISLAIQSEMHGWFIDPISWSTVDRAWT
jgi:hypothetical protein